MWKILATFVAICVVLFILWKYVQRELFTNMSPDGLTFMSAEETAEFLVRDSDGYVTNLSPLDLHARHVNHPEQYLRVISMATTNFTPNQKSRFAEAAEKADRLLEQEQDLAGICDVPWVFAMTRDDLYEEGLPHTRANIIFVSSNIDETQEALVKTLIHEKIHLYQRMFPEKMAQLMEEYGFKRWKQRLGVPRIRANPDLDPWVYYDTATEQPMMALYSSDTPAGITDVMLSDSSFEHPFEKMAYNIAARLVQNSKDVSYL